MSIARMPLKPPAAPYRTIFGGAAAARARQARLRTVPDRPPRAWVAAPAAAPCEAIDPATRMRDALSSLYDRLTNGRASSDSPSVLRKSPLPPTFAIPHAASLSVQPMANAPESGEAGPASNARETTEVTRLLHAYTNGNAEALDELIPLVYDTLKRVARRQLLGERKDHTLSTTALVHEAYLELSRCGDLHFNDRTHFFAAAAQTMRHVLVDYAVRRKAQKRGGDRARVPFEDVVLASEEHVEDLLSLDQALEHLEEVDQRLVRVVECRFFAGLTIAETAQALDISDATVSRDWTRARAWLNREMTHERSRSKDSGTARLSHE